MNSDIIFSWTEPYKASKKLSIVDRTRMANNINILLSSFLYYLGFLSIIYLLGITSKYSKLPANYMIVIYLALSFSALHTIVSFLLPFKIYIDNNAIRMEPWQGKTLQFNMISSIHITNKIEKYCITIMTSKRKCKKLLADKNVNINDLIKHFKNYNFETYIDDPSLSTTASSAGCPEE